VIQIGLSDKQPLSAEERHCSLCLLCSFQYIDLMSMYCRKLIYLEICSMMRFNLFSAPVLARMAYVGANGFFKKYYGLCY